MLVREKVVPLHPLSGKVLLAVTKRKSSLKVLHKTEEVVVQEARDIVSWVIERTVNEEVAQAAS